MKQGALYGRKRLTWEMSLPTWATIREIFLIATLLVTPLRQWFGWSALLRYRRMLGLYAFFYATIHLLLFLHFYLGWVPARVLEEFVERPYITVGMGAFLLMLPLAITSTRAMQRRLRRNWQRLHRAIYPVAVLVSLHYLWQARSDIGEALAYSLIFALLLGVRGAWALRDRGRGKSASLQRA